MPRSGINKDTLLDVKITYKGKRWIVTGKIPRTHFIFVGVGRTATEASSKLLTELQCVHIGLMKYFGEVRDVA